MKQLFAVILLMIFCVSAFAQGNPSFTAVFEKESKAVKLRWQHTDPSVTSYIVQRSSDNNNYTDIFTQQTADIGIGELMKFKDVNPGAAKYYYRLTIFRNNAFYSTGLPVMVIPSNTENNWVIYPVPVQSVLHLQYTGSGAIEGVITVLIQSVSSGRIFVKLRAASTSRNIDVPVANLGNGAYDIRLYIENDVVWNQRFIK